MGTAAAITSRNLSVLLLLLLLAAPQFLQSSSSAKTSSSPAVTSRQHRSLLAASQRQPRPRIPGCSEMVTRSQCSQNPNSCKWCQSEVLDDMCFTKTEAWRLPQQVFLCD